MKIDPVFSFAPISNSREGPSLCSSLKKWQIYEGQNSATFFYSEIEHCWLLHANSGLITMNGWILKDDCAIIENSARIGIGSKIFEFTNLSPLSSLSKVLSAALLKNKNLSLKSENILKIIQNNTTEYKDSFFVFDVLRKNPIFSYRYGELILNSEILHNDILLNRSSFKEPLKFEFENSFNKKERLNSINASTILSNRLFSTFNKEGMVKPIRLQWPLRESLEKYIVNQDSCSSSFIDKPHGENKRYINSYVVKLPSDVIECNENARNRSSSCNESNIMESAKDELSVNTTDSDSSCTNETASISDLSVITEDSISTTSSYCNCEDKSRIMKDATKQNIFYIQNPKFDFGAKCTSEHNYRSDSSSFSESNSEMPVKRKSVLAEPKRQLRKYDLDFRTVKEEIALPSDSELTVASFISATEIQRSKNPAVLAKSKSFVDHESINRGKCYEGYFPIREFEKTQEERSKKGIRRY